MLTVEFLVFRISVGKSIAYDGHELPVNMDIDQFQCEPSQGNNDP